MKLALIGFGQAGGKIVDAFVDYEQRTGQDIFTAPVAVNTAAADLAGLEHVPDENRVLIGQSRVEGHGVGGDNELGAEIAADDIEEMQGALDRLSTHEIDAFLIVAGLGGGTGSGGAPVLAEHLRMIYTEPVFGLGILPAAAEGGLYTLNAARSFRTFVREVDNLLVFDNDAWRSAGESMRGGFERINQEIARRFGILFGAGAVDASDVVGESVVDASDIINTLSGGGVSTVGYARETVETDTGSSIPLLGDDSDSVDGTETTNRVTSLVRKAALGRLTLPCDLQGTERSLLVCSGPPEHLNRKGIERGRAWLEAETGSMEVRGGDYPLPSADHVASVVLLAGVHQVPRVKELQRVAIEAKEGIAQRERDDNLQALLGDETEELAPLY
ncbi:cell division protein [Halobacteriales archaeon QS_4_62_28]|nr:MAG: cell division protein [Halobacteriales archaeon QS_4_62_28]